MRRIGNCNKRKSNVMGFARLLGNSQQQLDAAQEQIARLLPATVRVYERFTVEGLTESETDSTPDQLQPDRGEY